MKTTTKLLLIAIALGLLSSMGCAYTFGGVEQYVIDGRICTAVWWKETIVWSKYRNTSASKDTLRKDSIDAERIYKTIKSLK